MRVVIATINRSSIRKRDRLEHIYDICKELGLIEPIEVDEISELIAIFESDIDQKWILFSNFPPTKLDVDNEKSYSNTFAVFNKINFKYSFIAIHIITGAMEDTLSDHYIRDCFSRNKITIKREKSMNSDFIKSYFYKHQLYIEEVIKDTIR